MFFIKKHWAHNTNFEDTLRFIGEELHEKVLSEYMKISVSHKNATYLSENSVSLLLEEIGNWIKKQSVKEISKQEH